MCVYICVYIYIYIYTYTHKAVLVGADHGGARLPTHGCGSQLIITIIIMIMINTNNHNNTKY